MLTHLIARLLTTDLAEPAIPPAQTEALDDPGFDPSELPVQLFTHRRGIVDILTDLTSAQQPVRLMAPGLTRPDQTRIMRFNEDSRELVVKQLVNEDQHAALMKSRYVNVSTLYEGTPLLFSMHVVGICHLDSVPCYMLRQPTWMMRIQMRSFVRVKLPRQVEASLHWAPANQPPLQAQVLDLSESGVGFLCASAEPARLQVGCRIKLVDMSAKDIELLALQLVVRRVTSTEDGGLMVGASIQTSSESQRRTLRQYILLHQRNQSVSE